MALFSGEFSEDIWVNEHLEFKFTKNSLDETCESQNASVFPVGENITNISNEKSYIEHKELDEKSQNFIKETKKQAIGKKSRCFVQEIKKVLKKNKLDNNSKEENHEIWENSYLNVDAEKSKIHFKITSETERCSKNQEKSTKLEKDHCEKSSFNLQEFLEKNFDKENKKSALKKYDSQKNIKGSYFIDKNIKKKTHFVDFVNLSNSIENITNINDKSIEKEKNKQSRVFSHEVKEKNNHFDKFIEALEKEDFENISKKYNQNKKQTKKLTFKEAKKIETERQNNDDNLKLQRSLKRALSNVSLASKKTSQLNDSTLSKEKVSIAEKNHNEICFNGEMTFQEIHFTKLKQKVNNNMEKFQRMDEIRKNEERQQKEMKSNKKTRTFSAQPKTVFIVEGTAIADSRNDKETGTFNKDIEIIKRPNTALSRTGLEYYQRESHRRPISNRENRLLQLTGINNEADYFRTFTRTIERKVEELNLSKSERVVKNLQEKFSSCPKTARNKNMVESSRSSINNRPKSCRNSERPKESFTGIEYGKVTKKYIEKEKMKEKLFEIMIDCEEEKFYNKNLMKGIEVFEDFCENVDQGLKNITNEINQYLIRE